jgi:hypothetical protein
MTIPKRLSIILTVLLASCSVQKPSTVAINEAHRAYSNEQYAEAFTLYESYITQNRAIPGQVPDSIYRNTGLAAFQLGQREKALEYLNLMRHSDAANADTHYALALANRDINNLSREITALQNYVSGYPEGKHIVAMRERLFETYAESKNFDEALQLWPSIEANAKTNEQLLTIYFKVLEELQKEEHLCDIAKELLALNGNNTHALYYLGNHYFWKAENRYQSEMEAYEKNRTRRQYAQLLRGFDVLNADFRKSLDYLLKLYQLDPNPRYARLIGNIYLRFDDKAKATFYHNKVDNK